MQKQCIAIDTVFNAVMISFVKGKNQQEIKRNKTIPKKEGIISYQVR